MPKFCRRTGQPPRSHRSQSSLSAASTITWSGVTFCCTNSRMNRPAAASLFTSRQPHTISILLPSRLTITFSS